jgi:diguanylate cyclase (GGDEF)-like protein
LSLGLLVWVVLVDRESGVRLQGILFGAVIMVILVLMRQYLVLKENLRLYQAVQRIAWTDGLTGLYNRHFFNEMLPREMERARRYKGNLSVLLLDLNGFKKYNDTYGHLEGDIVLKSVARVCAGQLRSSDTIARFGGDEFVIILPSASRRVAQKIAARIQSVISENSFHGSKLGVTIGISVYRDGLSPEGLLEEADQDLYRHKANNDKG